MRSQVVFSLEFLNEVKLFKALKALDDLGLAWESIHITSNYEELGNLIKAFTGKPIFVFGTQALGFLLEKEGWQKLTEREENMIFVRNDTPLFCLKGPDDLPSVVQEFDLTSSLSKTYGRTFYLFPFGLDLLETLKVVPQKQGVLLSSPEIFFFKCHALIHLVYKGKESEAQDFFRCFKESAEKALKEKAELFYLGYRFLWEEVGAELLNKKVRVAVAESLTGGLISHLLTETPGASNYFSQGLVTYRTESKSNILGIGEIIQERGVISGEVALEMAQKARELGRAEIGIGITGLAGPGGGSVEIPVGTVFLAIVAGKREILRRLALKGNRQEIKLQSACWALLALKKVLESI